MGIFPDLFPSILRQDACEIIAMPKHDTCPRHDYSVRVSVGSNGSQAKNNDKVSAPIELEPIPIDKQDARLDPIFAVHRNNIALSYDHSPHPVTVTPRNYIDETICQLVENLSAARREQGMQPLILNPELCEHADFYATSTICAPLPKLPGPAYKMIRARHLGIHKVNTKVEPVMFVGRGLLQGARHGVRLISAEGLGALACSELWLSGKYKKHVYPIRSRSDHAPDCACAEWAAYKVVMDSARHLVGVARDPFGRWVVEFLDAEEW